MELTLSIMSLAVLLAALFFWGRGIVKSRKGDIILGFSILALICLASFVLAESSAVFSGVGLFAILFGVETLIVSAFARQDCPISRRDRISLGVGTLVVGLFSSMIV